MEWHVTKKEAGQKLLYFIAERLAGRFSAKYVKKMIDQNGCRINGRVERFASTLIGEGDCVVLRIPAEPSDIGSLVFEKKRILFEDESFLIYNKPTGVNCDLDGILPLLAAYRTDLLLVHRLDRDTTGTLILAKSASIKQRFIEQFKGYLVKKTYLTIVDGVLKKPSGIIENFLGKKKEFSGQSVWGSVEKINGSYACTAWKLLKTGKNASFLACYPKTGRTHQIRVHMAEIGHPLMGDFQYGKSFQCTHQPPRILLHASSLQFLHPLTNKPLSVEAPLPEDLQLFWEEIAR